MENLHLKNLKDLNHNISEIYLKKSKEIFNLQSKVLDYASKTKMKNSRLEIFKNEFIKYFRNYDYICYNEQGSFHRFTQIITELNNADIGADISKTSIFEDIHRYLSFTFIYAPMCYTPTEFEYNNIIIEFELNNGVIENIKLDY
jgi:hypothetical protein